MIELQPQRLKAPDVFPFFGQFTAHKQESKFGLDHRVISQVGQANHESRKTIKRCDHGNVTEFDPGSGPRETDEDQTGHDSQTKEAGHDFQCGHGMTVKGVRVGVPIAYSGHSFAFSVARESILDILMTQNSIREAEASEFCPIMP